MSLYGGGVISLFLNVGPVAKAVVGILLAFSLISWTIIFYKLWELSRVEKEGERFVRLASEVDSLKKLLAAYREHPDNPFYRLLLTAYKEAVGRENPSVETERSERLHNRMKIIMSEELERLERRLSFLATTANTAPFIGLFGTVWGIMDSFREIGIRGTTSLAIVAPGISEALVTTALGLFTAIPAVLGYNYFVGKLRGISARMENATLYISNLPSR
jgi:biopolymer transport protein TolQ